MRIGVLAELKVLKAGSVLILNFCANSEICKYHNSENSAEAGSMSKQQTTSIRMNPELWKQAKIYAIENGETLTGLLERLLRQELERRKKTGCK